MKQFPEPGQLIKLCKAASALSSSSTKILIGNLACIQDMPDDLEDDVQYAADCGTIAMFISKFDLNEQHNLEPAVLIINTSEGIGWIYNDEWEKI